MRRHDVGATDGANTSEATGENEQQDSTSSEFLQYPLRTTSMSVKSC